MVENAKSPAAARPDAFIWTKADQDAALQLGWGIFHDSDYGFQIQRFDDDPEQRFKTDHAAITNVVTMAALDGRRRYLYAKALLILEIHNPAEYRRIVAWERGEEALAA